MSIEMLLVWEYCKSCGVERDHELNTVALELECLTCKQVEQVTGRYADRMLADWDLGE